MLKALKSISSCPVVRTLCFHCRGHRFESHMPWGMDKKSSEEVPGQGRSVVPRLRRKQKSQNDLSIGNLVLSLEGSADSERRLIYCVDCESPNWPLPVLHTLPESCYSSI